jgi:hypothetical protein
MKRFHPILISGLLCAGFASSCTVTRVDSREGPARIEAHGIVEGHAALGILAETHLLHLDIFDGSSRGAIFELGLWKLLRLEVGIAGASASVGPFHVAVGVLSYEPRVPRMTSQEHSPEADDDESCLEEELQEEMEELEEALEEIEEELEAVKEASFKLAESSADSDGDSQTLFEVDPKAFTKE